MPTVGALFEAFKIARGKREQNAIAQAKGETPEMPYGVAASAHDTLDTILTRCQSEVEISPDDMNILMPFLTGIVMHP